jgi:hypothetical protein
MRPLAEPPSPRGRAPQAKWESRGECEEARQRVDELQSQRADKPKLMGSKESVDIKKTAAMDSEPKKLEVNSEEEQLEREMREIEELLSEVKNEEIRKTLREKYYVLLKKKLKKESEETESEASEPEAEPEVESEEKQEVEPEEKEEKLHGIKKFGIDKETIEKLFESNEGSVHGFLIDLADMLPEYFENNEEMKKYIKNKCYVALRVKTKFCRDGDEKDEQEDEYFAPHHNKRKILAQSLEDLQRIMKKHIPMIEGEIAEYIRNGSGYIVSGIKSVKLEVTPYKPGIRKARGHIELYP